ncbi:MAG: class I SAM-dependent methyltransferase [Candidatus Omnitrophica bacterium]|nr:class I SAM-dependent methyltransferase [Candidatus Omnitrophota bacterium]
MELLTIACNLCGSKEYKQLTRCRIEDIDSAVNIDDLSIVQCGNCGLVYVNPQPSYSRQELKGLYSEEYFKAPYMQFYSNDSGTQSNESFKSRLAWIGRYTNPGKLLDIGCAGGGFLKAAKEQGWEAVGVEVSESASKQARDRGFEVITGQLKDAGFKDSSFDLVSAGDIFEHICDPKSFLEEINRILKKGGLLYLAVPDFDGLYYRLALIVSKLNKKNYFVLPQHLYFFTKKTLEKYFLKTDFKILDRRSSQSTIIDKGLKAFALRVLFFLAVLAGKRDRILLLAEKR